MFGPVPRDYSLKVPRQKRRAALYVALSARNAEDAVRVVEDFVPAEPKTKLMAEFLKGLGLKGTILLLLPADVPEATLRAGRNIPRLTLLPARMVNPYAVLGHDYVVFTESGLAGFLEMVGAA